MLNTCFLVKTWGEKWHLKKTIRKYHKLRQTDLSHDGVKRVINFIVCFAKQNYFVNKQEHAKTNFISFLNNSISLI